MHTRRLITLALLALSLGCDAPPSGGTPNAVLQLHPQGGAGEAAELQAFTARLRYATYSLTAFHIDADDDGEDDDTEFYTVVTVGDKPGCAASFEAHIAWTLVEVALDTPGPIPAWAPVPGETIKGTGDPFYSSSAGGLYPWAYASLMIDNPRRDRIELSAEDNFMTSAEIVSLDEQHRLGIRLGSTLTQLDVYRNGEYLTIPIAVGLSAVITDARLCDVEVWP